MRLTTRGILEELKKKKEIARINRFNTFNKNNEKTEQEVENFLDKKWIEVKIGKIKK